MGYLAHGSDILSFSALYDIIAKGPIIIELGKSGAAVVFLKKICARACMYI